MKSGKCPKCGSENIYRSQPVYGLGLNSLIGHWIVIKLGMFRQQGARLVHFVCDDCQCLEVYVMDEESMNRIREAWTPLNPQKQKRKNDE
jgi:hypothetical protein